MGCSFCFGFQFQYQIQKKLRLTNFPLLVKGASNFSGIVIAHLLFDSYKLAVRIRMSRENLTLMMYHLLSISITAFSPAMLSNCLLTTDTTESLSDILSSHLL